MTESCWGEYGDFLTLLVYFTYAQNDIDTGRWKLSERHWNDRVKRIWSESWQHLLLTAVHSVGGQHKDLGGIIVRSMLFPNISVIGWNDIICQTNSGTEKGVNTNNTTTVQCPLWPKLRWLYVPVFPGCSQFMPSIPVQFTKSPFSISKVLWIGN